MARRLKVIAITGAVVVLGGLIAWVLFGALAIRPGLAADDPEAFLRAHLTALRWGYPVRGARVGDDLLFASGITITGPERVQPPGTDAEELQFAVSWRSVWRNGTGEPPGPRQRFVRVGRTGGGAWQVIGSGTGP